MHDKVIKPVQPDVIDGSRLPRPLRILLVRVTAWFDKSICASGCKDTSKPHTVERATIWGSNAVQAPYA